MQVYVDFQRVPFALPVQCRRKLHSSFAVLQRAHHVLLKNSVVRCFGRLSLWSYRPVEIGNVAAEILLEAVQIDGRVEWLLTTAYVVVDKASCIQIVCAVRQSPADSDNVVGVFEVEGENSVNAVAGITHDHLQPKSLHGFHEDVHLNSTEPEINPPTTVEDPQHTV